jgi:hypothetical protein
MGYLENDLKSLLTDASGRTILVTKDDKLSITGPVEITGPISITGPVSITGQMLIQTSPQTPQTTVTISGNMNCNINPEQYVVVQNPVTISGGIQCNFQPGQLISISGPVDISSSTVNVNMSGAVPNVTLQNPITVSGPITGNINQSENQVNVSGAAYTTLTDISAGLSYISTAPLIILNGAYGNIYNGTLAAWNQSPAFVTTSGTTFGTNCILSYLSSENYGDIAILGSTTDTPNYNWENIGIITPFTPYIENSYRFASTTINVAPFKYICIQNLSDVEVSTITCTLYGGTNTGVP